MRGRIIDLKFNANSLDTVSIVIQSEKGCSSFQLSLDQLGQASPGIGDWVEIGQSLKVLTAHRGEGQLSFKNRILAERRIRNLWIRDRIESSIRLYFKNQNFIETRTPLLVKSPGMEVHIRPFKVESGAYLPTSPEFSMKKLLVGGLEKIFQICPAFRNEPHSPNHHSEFTILEWYRAFESIETIQNDVEELLGFIAKSVLGSSLITFRNQEIELNGPWARFTVNELFQQHVGIDLRDHMHVDSLRKICEAKGLLTNQEVTKTWDDYYFLIWLNCIEPKLPLNQAFFITDYPPSQAALAVLKVDERGFSWAKRFEAYMGHLEVANAFEELTDPVEQLNRFKKDMEERAYLYGDSFPVSPIDDEFILALEEGMPPASGIALGVDRLVMAIANEPDLDQTLWLSSYQPHQ